MPYTSVTLSSVGNSNAVGLNWMSGKPVALHVTTNTSSGTGDFTIQYTLNDILLTTGGSTACNWASISSNPYFVTSSAAAAIHYASSQISTDGVFMPLPVSPAAVRLASTALSSNTLTLRVLQGE